MTRWGRTNQLIASAAQSLGVRLEPVSRDPTDYFVRLVSGERSVIVSKTRSPFLTQVAQTLANNKHVCREVLRAIEVPVVADLLLDESSDVRGPEVQSWLATHRRLVVKPNWQNRGLGIVTDVRDLDTLERAYDLARDLDRDEEVLCEPHLEGTNLRIAVIGNVPLAAVEVRRPVLVGDGTTTARAIIEALNADPRRSVWSDCRATSLDRIEAEPDVARVLACRGLGLDDAIPEGVFVEIPFEEDQVIDRTDDIAPGWMELARRACEWIGVDVGGVDLRGPIEAFCAEPGPQHAAVLEINVLPALHLHALPTSGEPRPVFEAFVRYCLQLPGAPPPCAVVRA